MSNSGHAAAGIWRQLRESHLALVEFQVNPRFPLPLQRLGAQVLGPPAWDPDFNSADLPMMMRVADLPQRFRKHFR